MTTSTTDNLTFNAEGEITIEATPQNFGKDAGNLSGSASAMAILRANNTMYEATANYYLYLDISNDFEYTTSKETAELILKAVDSNREEAIQQTKSGAVSYAIKNWIRPTSYLFEFGLYKGGIGTKEAPYRIA